MSKVEDVGVADREDVGNSSMRIRQCQHLFQRLGMPQCDAIAPNISVHKH